MADGGRSHFKAGSATIHFRQVLDGSVALTPDSVGDLLAYNVDVDWVDAYLSRPKTGATVWMSSPGSPSLVRRLMQFMLDTVKSSSTPEVRLVNALDTLGAVFRAAVRRPYTDFSYEVLEVLCGQDSSDEFLAEVLTTLGGLMAGSHTPVCLASATQCLLLLAVALPNLHENVLLDHFMQASADATHDALTGLLQQRALHRTVTGDAVTLLVILAQYQRYDTRNPFLARLRLLAVEAVNGPGSRRAATVAAGGGDSPTVADDHVSSISFTGRSLVPSSFASAVLGIAKALEAVATATRAHLCSIAQRPVLGTVGTRVASPAAAGVTTAGSLAPAPEAPTLLASFTGAVSSVWSFASRALRPSSAAVPPPDDCMGHMGSGAPPGESMRSPVRLPHVTRVAAILLMFYDAFCTTFEGMWLAAGGNTWRAHARAAPLPAAAPELMRQVLSLVSFALQSNERELPKLGLIILQRLLEGAPVPNPDSATEEDLRRAKAMHTLLHATYLDTESTTLQLFERGADGGFVVTTCRALPLSAALLRMTCHCISVRTKGAGVTGPIVRRAMAVLHRLLYHQAHGTRRAPEDGSGAPPRRGLVASPHGEGAATDWLDAVRALLRVTKRLVADGAKGGALPRDGQRLASDAACLLDMCLTGLDGASRLNVYYECIRERNALEAFRQLLLRVFAADAAGLSSRMDATNMAKPVFDALVGTLPVRLGQCVRNLNAILRHLAEHLSRAALALTKSGQHMLHEEDVIRVVADAAPWRQVEASDRLADAYTAYVEAPGDCGTFGGLARGLVEDLRVGMRLAAVVGGVRK